MMLVLRHIVYHIDRRYIFGFLFLLALGAGMLYIYFINLSIGENFIKEDRMQKLNIAHQTYQNLEATYIQKLAHVTENVSLKRGFVKAADVRFINVEERLAQSDLYIE